MLSLVYSRTDTGLLVAEQGAGRDAVAAALKQHDPDLRLVPGIDPKWQRPLWKVYVYHGPDRPATFLAAWTTMDGEPLPLSMRLLDLVKQQDRNGRAPAADADEQNRRLTEQRRREQTEAAEEAARQAAAWDARKPSPCFHRGIHLRRQRAGG